MDQEMMEKPEAAPEQEGGPEQIMEMMQKVGEFLAQLGEVAQGLPPEAAKALQTAQQSYGQFLQMAMGGAQGGEQPPVDPNAAGSKQAIPADEAMRMGR